MAEQQPEIKIKFIKKKGGHAAAHGGAWKVAYADLVTALMARTFWAAGEASPRRAKSQAQRAMSEGK